MKSSKDKGRAISDVLDNYNFYHDYEVRIDFEAFDLQGEILVFRPLFRFSSPAPASKTYRDVLIEKVPNEELYDFRCDAARDVWADAELSGEEAALLAKSTFMIEDINRLRELIGRRGFSIHPRLHIDFPYHAYTLKSENPVPRVDIKEYREGISLKVEFMIGGLPCSTERTKDCTRELLLSLRSAPSETT